MTKYVLEIEITDRDADSLREQLKIEESRSPEQNPKEIDHVLIPPDSGSVYFTLYRKVNELVDAINLLRKK